LFQSPRILRIGECVSLPDAWPIDVSLTAEDAVSLLAWSSYDAVVVSSSLAESVIEALADSPAAVPLIVADPEARASEAARYIRMGAAEVAGKDETVAEVVRAAIDRTCHRRLPEPEEPWRRMLVGRSPAMVRAAGIIGTVAKRRSTVLITGETGTGKEVMARALHMASARSHLPLITVNAAALPESLLEAELFGHVKGAFTGAVQHRAGRFEQAHRSTLFLDEIGDLPRDTQTKLLRFLQEREFQRVGSSETLRVDVRLIAATNVNLAERVREGQFREDLFYRLNVVPLSAPPLRERAEDIPLLTEYFLEKICRQEDMPLRRLTPEALARLKRYPWPGNVRQLENALEMGVAMSGERQALYASDFAAALNDARPMLGASAVTPNGSLALPDSGVDFDRTVESLERRLLEEALRKSRGNKTAAAEMLGLKRTTLSAKLRSLSMAAGGA
jgi:DNA-binding NtrC family response regulator